MENKESIDDSITNEFGISAAKALRDKISDAAKLEGYDKLSYSYKSIINNKGENMAKAINISTYHTCSFLERIFPFLLNKVQNKFLEVVPSEFEYEGKVLPVQRNIYHSSTFLAYFK